MAFCFADALSLRAADADLLGRDGDGDGDGNGDGDGDGEAAAGLGARPPSPLEAAAVADVWVRAVPSSVRRMRSQEDVGQLLWPAAPPLCRWLCAHRRLLLGPARGGRAGRGGRGPSVLEIGSGMGLCGIVAALLRDAVARADADAHADADESAGAGAPPPVTLSDFNAVVLANTAHNCSLNEPEREDDGHGGPGLPPPPLMRVARVDWSVDGGGEGSDALGRFDVVIGSDMICSEEDARGVAALLSRRLQRPAGVAVFVLAPPDVRWGVDALAPALATEGLVARERALGAEFSLADAAGGAGGDGNGGGGESSRTQSGGYEARLRLHVVRWA